MLRRRLSKNDNKYSRGVVAIMAGSKKYPGAALLALGGARRGNAGYVKFIANDAMLRNAVTQKYPDVVAISSLANQEIDALLMGPGESSTINVPIEVPLVLDSSAISLVVKKNFMKRKGVTVITPHEGELRFLGQTYSKDLATKGRRQVAVEIANNFGLIIVLKGSETIVAAPGNEPFIDSLGGPELATAGTGDVLAGLIASILTAVSNGEAPFKLVCNAVTLHSRAGRYAAKHFTSVTALEIIESLRHV